MSDQEYVTNDAWLRQAGRPDHVDEIADQFERPVAAGVQSFWSAQAPARWPGGSRGWRSVGRLHPRVPERRAG